VANRKYLARYAKRLKNFAGGRKRVKSNREKMHGQKERAVAKKKKTVSVTEMEGVSNQINLRTGAQGGEKKKKLGESRHKKRNKRWRILGHDEEGNGTLKRERNKPAG